LAGRTNTNGPAPAGRDGTGTLRRRLGWTLAGFGILAFAACLLAPLVGTTSISFARVFDRQVPYADNVDAQIFFVARLPRVIAAAMVGAALAAAGVIFQALLRNPLASPDTLGVSAGASLGAMLAITFDVKSTVPGIPSVPLASFAGSIGALGIVFGLSLARRRGSSTLVLLLGGVTVSAVLSAVIGLVQFAADFTQTFRNVRWLMGSLDVASYAPVLGAAGPLACAAVAMATLPRTLDLLSIGEESAAARGVNVLRSERVALVSASLATGAAVSMSGPVAFVGIVVPHLVRLMVGADHRLVLPGAALLGAALLVTCDVVARTIVAPLELPVGIVTAIAGGPVFLWLLFRRS
jgi:iron complex transport system permease protein